MQSLLEHFGLVLLVLAAVGWYVCVLIATAVLTSGGDTPGARAKAAWVCLIPVVLLAVVMGRYEIAVGMIFASSVACMTLVLGIVTFAAGSTAAVNPSRRSWGMLLPVSLICLLIGLSGGFDSGDAVILLAQGVAVYWVWADPPGTTDTKPQPLPPGRGGVMLAAVIGATLAGAAGVLAAGTMSPRMGLVNGGLVTALMLAPAMVLPLIGLGLQAAHEGRYDQFVGGLLGFIFLNLCLLLPMATVLWLARPPQIEVFNMDPTTMPASSPVTTPATASVAEEAPSLIRPLPYPMAVWRVDTVLLVAVGLLLLPVSLGRWSLGRVEAVGLIFTWVVFMLLTVLTTIRR